MDWNGEMSEERTGTPRDERDCGLVEYLIRRATSSLFYFRLYRWRHPDDPFYVPAAIRRIEDLLDNNSKVFEWGSGASTLWYARRAASVVSIEHDGGWYERGISALQEKGLRNVDLLFEPPVDPQADLAPEASSQIALQDRFPVKPEFSRYARKIDEYPDAMFDCIAIDGRARVDCLAGVMPKISETGFIVLDDSHWPKYREIFEILSEWSAERFDFGLLQTTVFTKQLA